MNQPSPQEAIALQAHYRKHPEWYFRNILGFEPYDKQIEIANSIVNNRTTTVASCNSAGKTGTAGSIVPWFLACWEESIVVTTAPTWRQVKDLLWREINTRYEKAKVPLGGDPPNMVGWQLSTNWFAVGVSSKDPNRIQGYHADSGHLLVICDEAAAIEEIIFEGVHAIMTSADCRLLMLGNPTSASGEFRDSFKPSARFTHKVKISAFDTPNFRINHIRNEDDLIEAVESGRELKVSYKQLISPVWAYERLKKWGQGSPMYQSRIRAEFPEVGENTLIPLSWIEKATTNERLEKILGLKLIDGDDAQEKLNQQIREQALAEYIKNQNTVRGADVARFGSDSTVITPRWGKVFGFGKAYHKEDTMQTAGRIWPQIVNLPTDITAVDVIGVGGGVVDRLHELQREQEALGHGQWAQVLGVDVATKPTEVPEGLERMEFANKRAELYWKMRLMFESDDVYLMPDETGQLPEDLMDELSCIQYEFRGNKIYIEEKKEMKKRLAGKSPDRADSAMLTLARNEYRDWHVNDKPADAVGLVDEDEEEPEPGRSQFQSDDQELSASISTDY